MKYQPAGKIYFDMDANSEMLLVNDLQSPYNGWVCRYDDIDGCFYPDHIATDNDKNKAYPTIGEKLGVCKHGFVNTLCRKCASEKYESQRINA